MLYKQDWDKTKERLNAFWNMEIIDRCCIAVTAPKDNRKHSRITVPKNPDDLLQYHTDPEIVYKRSIHDFENTYFGGDAIPNVSINLGAVSAAGFLGSKPRVNNEIIWFEQCIFDLGKDKIDFSYKNSEYWKLTKNLTEYCSQMGKDKFLVGMSDVGSASDVLAKLRGSQNLLMEFLLDPKYVKETIKKIADVLIDVNESLYQITKKCNDGGTLIPWLNTWAPGRHAQMECDLSAMFSAKMFEEFIVPHIKQELSWHEYSLYHLDGPECLQHLDHLLDIEGLRVIEWHSGFDSGKPNTVHYIDMLKKIQMSGRGLHLLVEPWEVEIILGQLSSKGLYIETWTKSEAEARDLVKKTEKWTRE